MNPKEIKAPRWAHRFLAWFLKEELMEEVENDLLEKYEQQPCS